MLKGHVFKKQTFRSEIFAFWIDTLLDHKCGIGDYKNKMKVTYSGRNITVGSGLVCIRGRLIEEDTSYTLTTGTDTAFCKLVIEVDLDKENTENELNQVSYKIVKETSGYFALTQNDIVKNNSGKYQYELARFKTGTSGITNFQDMRTYLDFTSVLNIVEEKCNELVERIEQRLKSVEDGSAYVLNNRIATVTGNFVVNDYSTRATIQYPAGFDMNNCTVLAAIYKTSINSFKTTTAVQLNQFNILIEKRKRN